MRALSASELLSAWEQGQAQPPVQQALRLLAAACPEMTSEALARLSIGQRDASLLTLREWTFGPQLVGLANCPHCNERLELTFNIADIRASPKNEPEEVHSLSVAESVVRWRLPNSLDAMAMSGSHDVDEARKLLLARCVLTVQQGSEERSTDQLPPEIANAVVQQMAEADPQADVQLALACPACGHAWQAAFDIISFFWSEINAWAYRTLREVHTLAQAYGWTERDILALSPQRQQFYLEMAAG
jgi:uncharacterized protein (UPF0212 family)